MKKIATAGLEILASIVATTAFALVVVVVLHLVGIDGRW